MKRTPLLRRLAAHSTFIAALAGAFALLSPPVGQPAYAADYPTKPVRMLVGAAAGSSGDVFGRILADQLGNLWKQSVVVDNRPGAGGVIAIQALLAAPPDGYTVLLSAGSYLVVTPFTQANLPYDVEKDLAHIAMVAELPLVLGVAASVPARTVPEFIAYAKANPGKISYGANTPGTFPHLGSELFASKAGIKLTYVPYKGSAAAIQDVMGGRLDMVVEGMQALTPGLKGGSLRPLAVTSSRRMPQLPDVPAAAETVPGYAAVGFFCLVGNAKMPAEITQKLNEYSRQALARPETSQRIIDAGADTRSMSAAELTEFVRSERATWGPVIKSMGFATR
jgi:tripartite-type tricarboxylate transporter receptor subunit TctC